MRHEPTSGYEDPSLNYRVTWRSVDEGGTTHERIFTSRDQGWDFYEQKQKSAGAYAVTWEHIPVQVRRASLAHGSTSGRRSALGHASSLEDRSDGTGAAVAFLMGMFEQGMSLKQRQAIGRTLSDTAASCAKPSLPSEARRH